MKEPERQNVEPLILRRRDIQKMLRISESGLRGWLRAGRFPMPFMVGGAMAWLPSDIERWLHEQSARRAGLSE